MNQYITEVQDEQGADLFEGIIELLETQGYSADTIIAPRRYPKTENLPMWTEDPEATAEQVQQMQRQENCYIYVMAKDYPSQLNINFRSHCCKDNPEGMYVTIESMLRLPEENIDVKTVEAIRAMVAAKEGWKVVEE